jgi:molybdopterin synthase catalytic subunit
MATWHSEILITTAPLESRPNNWGGNAGASLDFWGVVRQLEDGREITGIDYEAHQAMAEHQIKMIANAARAEFGLEEVILQHRIGFVAAGEASLFLRVASTHRGAAWHRGVGAIAQLKQKAPSWKRPIFVGHVRAATAG